MPLPEQASAIYIAVNTHFDFFICLVFTMSIFLFKTFAKRISSQYTLFNYVVFFNLICNYFISEATYFDDCSGTLWITYIAKFTLIVGWGLYIVYLYIIKNDMLSDDGERLFCIDTALAGSLLFISAKDYLDIYIALEVVAFATYILIASDKNRYSAEAALKYFLYSVYGSFMIALSFIYTFTYSGQTFFNLVGIMGFKTLNLDISAILLLSAFFAKLGVGIFYGWVAPVYQAISNYAFLFISTVSKIIILFPFVLMWDFIGLQGGNMFYYYIFTSLIFANFISARNLLTELNFRRIAAYSSIINFGIAILGLFIGQFSFLEFTYFVIVYLIGTFATYSWHTLVNCHDDTGKEVTNINKFKFVNPVGNEILSLSLIINSGLPPVTLFLYKIIIIGAITYSAGNGLDFSSIIMGLIIVLSNIPLYYSYITIIYKISFADFDKTPGIVADDRLKVHFSYIFFTIITFLVIITFYSISENFIISFTNRQINYVLDGY